MQRIFYSGTKNASSWAFRAWLALREANIEFEEIVVDIRQPQRIPNLDRIRELSPAGAVPVLVEQNEVIFDSMAIMEYANELCGGRLLPADARSRARCRSFISWQHSGLSDICPKLSFESAFYPDKRKMCEIEISQSDRLFQAWEEELHKSDGLYLHGNVSLSDLIFVPTIVRINSHAPDLEQFPRTKEWIELMLARESVKKWLEEAHTLPPVLLGDGYHDLGFRK